MIHYLHGLKMDVGKILTHCRACGVEKEKEGLFNCDWCGCCFCGLHYIMSEDMCDECYMNIKSPNNEQQHNKIPAIIDSRVSDRKVIVFYGISKDHKPVMMEFKTQ